MGCSKSCSKEEVYSNTSLPQETRKKYNNYKYICTQSRITSIYIRQLLTTLKGEVDNNIIVVGDFNTPLITMDRSSRQKINKETQALNEALDQLDLIHIYRTFHSKAGEYTFFSSAHGTYSKIDHILGYKSNLGNLKKIEIVSSIFSDHNAT